MIRIPGVTLTEALALRIDGAAEVSLSPRAAFELAEGLIRGGTRKAVAEAAREFRGQKHGDGREAVRTSTALPVRKPRVRA